MDGTSKRINPYLLLFPATGEAFWQPVRANLSFPCSSSQFISSCHACSSWEKPKLILLGLAEILNLNRSYYDYHQKLKIFLESDDNDDDDFPAVATKGADRGELNFEFSRPIKVHRKIESDSRIGPEPVLLLLSEFLFTQESPTLIRSSRQYRRPGEGLILELPVSGKFNSRKLQWITEYRN